MSGDNQADILDAVLGRENFTQEELQQLDFNNDGKVDVADLIVSTPSTTPRVQFVSTSSSEFDRSISLGLN